MSILFRSLFAIFLVVSINSCAGEDPPASSTDPEEAEFAVVRTFFATDRNLTENSSPDQMFGNSRGDLNFGVCEVSIPHDHKMGELESPFLRLEFFEDPAKHIVLLDTIVKSRSEFFKDIATQLGDSGRDQAFLFVHGYNVSFEDAARRTAQISYDLAFEGAPVFYSWPSQGSSPAYTVDEQNIEWAETNLKSFLSSFFSESGAEDIFLIAHSMGNRALTRAVADLLEEKPDYRARLKEIILAAPDIDAAVFKRDIAPKLASRASRVTLYASSEDIALKASKKVHGNPRAGESGGSLVIVDGVETIDATGLDTGFLKHSYYAETRSVLSDMYYLINDGKPADDRFGLEGVDTLEGRYWEFRD